MKTQIVQITPKLAQQYLCHNADNRILRDKAIDRIADDMKNGAFQLTHQGIAFDTNGRLVDGQHRLQAIVRSGATVPMLVSEGVDPKTFSVLDQNIKRSPADILNCNKRVAEVVSTAARYFTGDSTPTPRDLQRVYVGVGPLAAELQASCGTNAVYFTSAAMKLAAILRIFSGQNKEYVLDLYGKLARGEVAALPPVAEALMKMRLRGTVTSTNRNETLARGLQLFDERAKDRKKLTNPDEAAASEFARTVLMAVLGKR